MSRQSLRSLYAQKSWANNELFNALATLDAAQHAATLHNAIRTLNHIYVVDRIFLAHLRGEAHGFSATNTDATPALDELQFAAAETDAALESYLANVSDAQLAEAISFRFTDGDTGKMTREEILFHLISHGASHRGNVGQMMKSISIAPPRDLFTKFLHLREPERRQG